jgi:hypothetical protein
VDEDVIAYLHIGQHHEIDLQDSISELNLRPDGAGRGWID